MLAMRPKLCGVSRFGPGQKKKSSSLSRDLADCDFLCESRLGQTTRFPVPDMGGKWPDHDV
eukprot:13806-Eustigmatos_ZCMA.PRE.1